MAVTVEEARGWYKRVATEYRRKVNYLYYVATGRKVREEDQAQ